ncbi:hypothetical protein EsH8_VI_001091 [Colletotrichum jinshuiense]
MSAYQHRYEPLIYPDSPEKPCQLFLDDSVFPITQSLNDALRDLRDATRVRRIWADALCIDQQNIPERNSQVSMMGRIYSTAHSTVIHLGDLTADGHHVFSAAAARQCRETAPNSTGNRDGEIAGLRDLLARTWFTRVWVLQELVLSKDPWVQCGHRRVRWTDFCSTFLPGTRAVQDGGDEKLRILADMNSSRANNQRLPLHRAIQARRGLGATDPRDFVYANLGIISDLGTVNRYFYVDYSVPASCTFGKVAQYMFDALGVGSMVFHTDNVRPDKRMSGLPSWAPDWSRAASGATPMYKDNYLDHMRLVGVYHAFTDGDLPLVLGHIGFVVDTIENLSYPIPSLSSEERPLYVTAAYEQARADLVKMYRNGYASGDKFGTYRHVPLKGKEAEHESLCRIIAGAWIRFLEDHCVGPRLVNEPESVKVGDSEQRDLGIVNFFTSWVSSEATKQREFVGSDARGIVGLFGAHFARTKGRSTLAGRLLASTRGGRCGVVPAQARPGDTVAYLAGSETAVVLRRMGHVEREQEINGALLGALRRPGRGVVSMTYQNAQEEFWKVPEQGDVDLEHCIVIGEAYLDGYVGWALKYPPKDPDMRVFALH